MEDKLFNASMEFYRACDVKLELKEKEGFTGWNNPENKKLLKGGFEEHICKALTQDNLVDIANYCMFLWNLIQGSKKGGEKVK